MKAYTKLVMLFISALLFVSCATPPPKKHPQIASLTQEEVNSMSESVFVNAEGHPPKTVVATKKGAFVNVAGVKPNSILVHPQTGEVFKMPFDTNYPQPQINIVQRSILQKAIQQMAQPSRM